MSIKLLFSLLSLTFSFQAFSQIWAELSSGISFTTVNPSFNYSLDLDTRVDSARGTDHQISFSGTATPKIRYLFRMGYNQHHVRVFYSKRESQTFTEQLDASMQSKYLSLLAAPIWHKGNRLEFTYGLGGYLGFLFYSRLDGNLKTIEVQSGETIVTNYPLRNVRAEAYRNMATGLFTTLGLNYSLSEKLKIGLSTDLILFLNAKNIIFQDTGSTNEINMRLGISYLFEKRLDEL